MPSHLKGDDYALFNSANFYIYNPYIFKLKKAIRLERVIVEEVKDGKILISCRIRLLDLKVHFRRIQIRLV